MIKGRMKTTFFLFFIALILCLSGCGIPNYYVPNSSDVSVSSSSNSLTIRRDVLDSDLVKDGFPRIYLFYQIYPEGTGLDRDGFHNVIVEFNDTIADSTNGQRINISANNSPVFTEETTINFSDGTSESIEFGLYQFKSDDEFISSYDQISETILSSEPSSISWILSYPNEEIENPGEGDTTSTEEFDSDRYLNLTITRQIISGNNSVTNTEYKFNLSRYNGNPFSGSYFGSEIPSQYLTVPNTGFILRIYALANFEFNEYNNVYNSKLTLIDEIRL